MQSPIRSPQSSLQSLEARSMKRWFWGPLAGYFASLSAVAMRIEPVTPALDDSKWPMV
jgi:hypothetical protein